MSCRKATHTVLLKSNGLLFRCRCFFLSILFNLRIFTNMEQLGIGSGDYGDTFFFQEPEVNDTESYDNGTGVIPTYLCDPVVVTVDNYKEMLIDSGYYTEDQIQ